MEEQDLAKAALDVSEAYKADVLLYSGDIEMQCVEKILELTAKPDNENVFFLLCTNGGCPNAAFKIARRLQDKYNKITLYVRGFCKSAGTFIAIGSDEIIMSDFAEFGPLDVQLPDKDEISRYSSGLNINEALVSLRYETNFFFRQMVGDLALNLGISTKMATEIASHMSSNFFTPIISQIDPLKIGEIRRALRIATAYGERLIQDGRGNLQSERALATLVETYPDHGFVIDFKEAQTLFKNISRETDIIENLGKCLPNFITYPDITNTVIAKIYPKKELENGTINQQPDGEGTAKSEGTNGVTDIADSGKNLSAGTRKKAA